MDMPQVFSRAFNTPLLVHPAKAQAFVSGFGPRLWGRSPEIVGGVEDVPSEAYRTAKPFASLLDQRLLRNLREAGARGYVVRDGIAVIPVTGVLVHRGAWLQESSGQTSYEGLEAQLRMAAEDPEVAGIALEIDSFGGEVAGCFGLSELIREINADKPVWAFVAEHAFSAAYSIASQASRIVVPRTGGVGSIGVIMMHADFSQALEGEGIKVTIIAAGAHKGEGNPYEPLPDDVRDKFQSEAETLRAMFAETVGAGRGSRLTKDGALATEAESYLAADALEAGLADAIAEPREAFEEFAAELRGTGLPGLSRSRSQAKGQTMTKKTRAEDQAVEETEEQTEGEAETTEEDEVETPAATGAAPKAEGGERKRIAAILGAAEAEGREDLAKHFAFETDLSPEAAQAALAKAPKASGRNVLAEAMNGDDTDLVEGPADARGNESMKSVMASRYGDKAA